MKTLDELTQGVDTSLDAVYQDYQTNFDKLVKKRDLSTMHLRNLRSLLPRVIEGLAKENLVLDDLSYYMNASNDRLIVSVTATSNGKFKFIKFQGYTARGAGKNQDALTTKGQKMEQRFQEATQITMHVNSASLELGKDGIVGRVLIDLYI